MSPKPTNGSPAPRGKSIVITLLITLLLIAISISMQGSPITKVYAASLAPTPTITPVSDPVVIITSPTTNSVLSTTQAPITITAVANGGTFMTVVQVSFSVDGTVIGSSTSAPYSVSWSNVTVGSHTLKATAFFNNGSSLSAPLVMVTVVAGSPTVIVTPTATSTGAGCNVHYQMVNQWPGGFTANITITNTGSTTIDGWTLAFTFPGDQKITQIWNGSLTQSGEQVSISNLSYNAIIPPNGTVNPGFNGSWTSNNTSPTSFTLNGQTCTTN